MLLLALVQQLLCCSVITCSFVNRSVRRKIFITSPLVIREEYSITVELLGADDNYIFALPDQGPTKSIWTMKADSIVYVKAVQAPKDQGTTPTSLPVSPMAPVPGNESTHRLGLRRYSIDLANVKGSIEEGILNLVVFVAWARGSEAWPTHQPSLTDPLGMSLRTWAHIYSPYPIVSERTDLLLQNGKVDLSCPTPYSTEPQEVASSGLKQYSCGPYQRKTNDIPAGSEPSLRIQWTPAQGTSPMLSVKRLQRRLNVVPWRGKVLVTEVYDLQHEGFRLEGDHYSRVDLLRAFSRASSTGQSPRLQAVSFVPLVVPSSATDISIRDQVGLLTTPWQLRDFPPGTQIPFKLLEVSPRFPLVAGGWKSSFSLSYAVPLEFFRVPRSALPGHIASVPSTSRTWALGFPLFSAYLDLPMEGLEVTVELPSAARNIRYALDDAFNLTDSPFPVLRVTQAYALKENGGSTILVLFDLDAFGIYRSHLVGLVGIILALGTVWLLCCSFDYSLDEHRQGRRERRKRLAALFEERRGLLTEMVCGGSSSNYLSTTVDAIEGELRTVESSIVATVLQQPSNRKDGNTSGLLLQAHHASSTSSLVLVTLRKLYEEQRAMVKTIRADSGADLKERLAADAVEIDRRIGQCEEKLLKQQ